MVDQAKRNTLIMLSGSALVTAMPALAGDFSNLTNIAESSIAENSQESLIPLSGLGREISIALQIGDQSRLTITNQTDKLIILRHVYPGIVHAGYKTFDINSVFERSAYAISAGKSRSMAISETYSTQAEVTFPRNTRQPIRAAHLVAQSQTSTLANSTRSFYS